MADPRDESPVLPVQHLRMALRVLDGSTDLVERLLKGTGISLKDLENPHLEMPAAAIWPLCDNIAATFGEDWFLKLLVLWSSDIHSELGMAMRVAPDFRTAIDIVTEFAHIRWPLVRLSRMEDPGNVIIAVKLMIPTNRQNWQLAMCIVALAFQTIARTILSHGSETMRYQFEGAPPFYAERLSPLFEGNISWGHRRAAIIVPKALCSQTSPVASDAPFTALLSALRKLAATQGRPHSDIAAKVSQTLDSMTRGRLDAVEVARKIGISKRTLERRLTEEGTSFRDLSNESYKKRLEHLLLDPRMTADAIAERLGYHDASSLLRASRRLYGISLSQLRRQVCARRSS
jgi:AraC-like DNA-binding protein